MTTPPLTHTVEGLMALVKSFGDIEILHAIGKVSSFERQAAWLEIQSYAVWLVDATAVDAAAEALKAPRNSAGETPTEHAHRWATELAVNMHRKFYPEVTQWKPFPDLLGVITQIDNMSCGLVRAEADEPGAKP